MQLETPRLGEFGTVAPPLLSRKELGMHPLKPSLLHVCVNLRRRDICMAQHHLDGAEVGSMLQ